MKNKTRNKNVKNVIKVRSVKWLYPELETCRIYKLKKCKRTGKLGGKYIQPKKAINNRKLWVKILWENLEKRFSHKNRKIVFRKDIEQYPKNHAWYRKKK